MKRILFKTFLLSFYCISTNLNSAVIVEQRPIPAELIKNDDIEGIKKAIEQGYDVNGEYENGFFIGSTPLATAVYYNKINTLKFLLANGAKINGTAGYEQSTPLMRACQYGLKEIVELLIESRANLNSQDIHGDNALIYADTRWIEKDLIKLLLNVGVDYNQPNKKGDSFRSRIHRTTRLLPEFEQKRKEIIPILEEFIKNQENKLINQLIQLTEQNKIKEVIEILQTKPNLVDRANEIGETILSQSILFGHFDLIKELFENDSIIQKPDLLIDKEEDGSFGPNNPVQYAIYLKNKVYKTFQNKVDLIEDPNFKNIVNYLTEKKLQQKMELQMNVLPWIEFRENNLRSFSADGIIKIWGRDL